MKRYVFAKLQPFKIRKYHIIDLDCDIEVEEVTRKEILGWLNDSDIREICSIDGAVRLVITLGYADENDKLRVKNRKNIDKLAKIVE
jgi:hypothetical protein